LNLGNKLNQFYTFILNKENRALNYYKTLVNASYNSIQNLNITFDINKLNSFKQFYNGELLLIKDVFSKYDVSKIMKNYYQDKSFNDIIPDDLNWLVLKCDSIETGLSIDSIQESNYKFHFCYSMKPFNQIYYLYNIMLQRYCNDRKNISLYMLSKKCVDSNFNNFVLSAILIYILAEPFSNHIQQELTFSDVTTKLLQDFNNYIDDNSSIITELNKYIFNYIYDYYIEGYPNIDTQSQFLEIKTVFENYFNRNKISLFSELIQTVIPTLLSLSYVLDIIDYLYSNNIDLVSDEQMYSIINTEQSVYSEIMSNHSLIKMTNYMIIPYKYRDPVKFIHLLPIVIEPYVNDYLYPEINEFNIFDKLIYNCGIDYLQFDYTNLSSTINSYISSVPDYFVAKSNYESIVDLAVSLQLHKILSNFFNSDEYQQWQIDYLKDFDSKVEYNPQNSNYIYKQDFVKLFLVNNFLYSTYVNNFTFGSLTHNYVKNQVYNYISNLNYEFTEDVIENEYKIFTSIHLNSQFKKFVDTFIFSSLINDIVVDRLNYYLLK